MNFEEIEEIFEYVGVGVGSIVALFFIIELPFVIASCVILGGIFCYATHDFINFDLFDSPSSETHQEYEFDVSINTVQDIA